MDLWNFDILPPEDRGSLDLWDVGILPQHYTVSQLGYGDRMDLWNVGVLPQHYTVSLPGNGDSMDLWNVGILPPQEGISMDLWNWLVFYHLMMEAAWTSEMSVFHHNTTRHHNVVIGGSMDLWNVGILPQHYTVSQPGDRGSTDLWNVGILRSQDGISMDFCECW